MRLKEAEAATYESVAAERTAAHEQIARLERTIFEREQSGDAASAAAAVAQAKMEALEEQRARSRSAPTSTRRRCARRGRSSAHSRRAW